MINEKESVKVEITQDKIVDLLLHAATREDIAKFSNEAKTDNEKLRHELKSEIQDLRGEFKSDINRVEMSLKDAILELKRSNEAMEARIDRQFQKTDSRYNWIIGMIITSSIALASLVYKLH